MKNSKKNFLPEHSTQKLKKGCLSSKIQFLTFISASIGFVEKRLRRDENTVKTREKRSYSYIFWLFNHEKNYSQN